MRSRSRSLTDLNAQEKTTARATVSRENANDNNTATALEDSAEETLTDEVFYGFTDSESVFENQEVPDWTPEEESEVDSFMHYREPAGDMEMGTGPIPHRHRGDSPVPPPVTSRAKMAPPPPAKGKSQSAALPTSSTRTSTPTTTSTPNATPTSSKVPPPSLTSSSSTSSSIRRRVSFSDEQESPKIGIQQFERLLDVKLVGLARSDEVRRVNRKVDGLSHQMSERRGEIADLRGEVEQLKHQTANNEERQLELVKNTVREEFERRDKERKNANVYAENAIAVNAANTAPALPPAVIDLVSTSSEGSRGSSGPPSVTSVSSWAGSDRPPPFLAGARTKEQEDARREAFETSCRTLLIWPLSGRSEGEMRISLNEFLVGALQFRASEVGVLGVLRIYRSELPASAHVYDEVRVIFRDRRARDAVNARARHLGQYVDPVTRKPTAGFRMDVPDYLAGDFKTLEETGYQLKGEYGDGFRKYIKYNHSDLSLYLEVSFSRDDRRWTRITPRMAREIRECEDRDVAELIKRRLRSRSSSIESPSQTNMPPPYTRPPPPSTRRPRPMPTTASRPGAGPSPSSSRNTATSSSSPGTSNRRGSSSSSMSVEEEAPQTAATGPTVSSTPTGGWTPGRRS